MRVRVRGHNGGRRDRSPKSLETTSEADSHGRQQAPRAGPGRDHVGTGEGAPSDAGTRPTSTTPNRTGSIWLVAGTTGRLRAPASHGPKETGRPEDRS